MVNDPGLDQDPLLAWAALEVRRKSAAFRQKRALDDDEFKTAGREICGQRVRVALRAYGVIAVELVDGLIERANSFRSSPEALAEAQQKIASGFLDEAEEDLFGLASLCSSGGDGAVRNMAKEAIAAVRQDIAGAFTLLNASPRHPQGDEDKELTTKRHAPSDRSGAPGRPSSRHIVREMMVERFKQNTFCGTMGEEARELVRLFEEREDYKLLARISAKSIQNDLGSLYRKLKAS